MKYFFYNFPNIPCFKYTVNSNLHLIQSKTLPTNDFELTVPDLYLNWLIPLNTGDCDHLELYPLNSEIINITSWEKPWIPELDWLNSYINLSIYDKFILDGLAVGYKVTKYTKYMASSKWGCFLRFQWDAELADAYYYEHYNNTNETMLLISPYIPMRTESFKKLYKIYSSSPMIWMTGMYYRPGLLKEVYQQGDLRYVHTWRLRLRLRQCQCKTSRMGSDPFCAFVFAFPLSQW